MTDSSARLRVAIERLDARINWERRARRGARFGLESMGDLCQRLGEPQRNFHVVHVAGTKGKGSLCALVAAGLEAAGLRAGVYASPTSSA